MATPAPKRSATAAGLSHDVSFPSGPRGAAAARRLSALESIVRPRLPAAVDPGILLDHDKLRSFTRWSDDDATFLDRLPGTEGMPFEELDFEEKLYARLTGGERGLASLYCLLASGSIFTSGTQRDPHIWAVDAEGTFLWQPITPATWRASFIYYLAPLCVPVQARIHESLQQAVMCGNKAEAFDWKAARTKLEVAIARLNKVGTEKDIATKAFEFLFDHAKLEALDGSKTLLSFQNGVLDLETQEFRARRAEDLLSYALPYDFDPEADTSAIERLFNALWDTPDTVAAARTLFGYCLTGLTTEKMFHQIAAPSNSGKTKLFQVLTAAMGEYASNGVVPIGELSTVQFEGTLIEVLQQKPAPRLIVIDEIKEDTPLKAELVNRLSDGCDDQFVTLAMKHVNNVKRVRNCAKYFLLTNYFMELPAAATGLAFRARNIGLSHRFVDAPVPGSSDKKKDDALILELMTNKGRQGTMAWLVSGAFAYFARAPITCPVFEASSFELTVRGDVYLAWLTEMYFPTGSDDHKISLASLVGTYKAENRNPRTNAKAFEGIKFALATMSRYVFCVEWACGGAPEVGYKGLRQRRVGDLPWLEAVQLALSQRIAEREDAEAAAVPAAAAPEFVDDPEAEAAAAAAAAE